MSISPIIVNIVCMVLWIEGKLSSLQKHLLLKEREMLLRLDNCKTTSFPNIYCSLSLLFFVQGINGMRIPSCVRGLGTVHADIQRMIAFNFILFIFVVGSLNH